MIEDRLFKQTSTNASATVTTGVQTLIAAPGAGKSIIVFEWSATTPSTASGPETVTFGLNGAGATAAALAIWAPGARYSNAGSGFVENFVNGNRLPPNCGLTVIGATGGLACVANVTAKIDAG